MVGRDMAITGLRAEPGTPPRTSPLVNLSCLIYRGQLLFSSFTDATGFPRASASFISQSLHFSNRSDSLWVMRIKPPTWVDHKESAEAFDREEV